MKILLFGGSFDPVHRGHLALLAAAERAARPDRIVLLATGKPPHKPAPAAAFADRAAMLRAALRQPSMRRIARKARIDAFEARGRGPHYTYRTLRHLAARRPGAEFLLLLGSDQLAYFPHWRRRVEVARRCRILAGLRRGTARPKVGGVLWLPGTFPAVSSSAVRRRLAAGEPPGTAVPAPVRRIIARRGLYGSGWVARLRAQLQPGRFAHTLAVSKLAGELAARHGLDPWKAQQAALLHDAGRTLDLDGLTRYARVRRLLVPRRREVEQRAPLLLHAYVGADLARRRFGVRDPEVLEAVAEHTLGRPGMRPLAQLLYAADAASEDRGFPAARAIRAAARRGLLRGVAVAARHKLAWVRKQGLWEHPRGRGVLEWAERGLRAKG